MKVPTLQNRGSILYSLSSFSASVRGCGGCVYSANSFLRCISPSCRWEAALAASAGSAAADPAAPRNLRIKFILTPNVYAIELFRFFTKHMVTIFNTLFFNKKHSVWEYCSHLSSFLLSQRTLRVIYMIVSFKEMITFSWLIYFDCYLRKSKMISMKMEYHTPTHNRKQKSINFLSIKYTGLPIK